MIIRQSELDLGPRGPCSMVDRAPDEAAPSVPAGGWRRRSAARRSERRRRASPGDPGDADVVPGVDGR